MRGILSNKLFLVALSVALLSGGWLGFTGLTLFVGLVPLLLISSWAEDTKKGWWSTFRWALLNFVGWNLATIWWIGYATPAGPVAATLASSFYSMLAFMTYHTISKRAPKALAYAVLISLWITFEKFYTDNEFSWPWLLLGNGFSNDLWAIQWYEYTGIFGGTLWVLLSNILFFEVVRDPMRRRIRLVQGALMVVLPLIFSLIIFWSYDNSSERSLEVSIVQPNIDFYNKIDGREMELNILSLLNEVPKSADLVVLPETVLPMRYWVPSLHRGAFIRELRDSMQAMSLDAKLLLGVSTLMQYDGDDRPYTARPLRGTDDKYYDLFNSAVALSADDEALQLRHKTRLVIGVEHTPPWVLDMFNFLGVDMGNIAVGQLGIGDGGESFDVDSAQIGAVICYEGLYGEFYGGFVNDGAEMIAIISNDCWWHESPGFRHLYTLSSLRAIEYRRSIARSANTGRSGFIDERGVSLESMEWGERGVMTRRVSLNSRETVYARLGDLVARVSWLVAALSLLYYVSYRVRKRHYLVD